MDWFGRQTSQVMKKELKLYHGMKNLVMKIIAYITCCTLETRTSGNKTMSSQVLKVYLIKQEQVLEDLSFKSL